MFKLNLKEIKSQILLFLYGAKLNYNVRRNFKNKKGTLSGAEHSSSANKCTCRTPNPDIPRAVRVGSAQGAAAGRGGAGQDGTSSDRIAQETTDHRSLQGIERNCPARLIRSMSLCLDTQEEFFAARRDYRVETSVSGWNNRL